jgi:hypothetical protein
VYAIKDQLNQFEKNLQKLYRFFVKKVRSGPGSGSDLAKKFQIRGVIHNIFFFIRLASEFVSRHLSNQVTCDFTEELLAFFALPAKIMLKVKITSVVDRYRFHADPDPTLHVDAYPDPDPD